MAQQITKNTNIKFKRIYPGRYDAIYMGWNIDLYQAESKKYWSSTIEHGEYGTDDWEVISIPGYTKKELSEYIKSFIINHNGNFIGNHND